MLENIIIIVCLAVIIGLAILYIYKAKQKGNKCIGCPHGSFCSSADKKICNSNCCCAVDQESKESE